MLNPDRKNVLCIGSLSVSKKPFDEHGLNLVNVELNAATKGLNEARGIIIAEPFDKMGSARECITKLKNSASHFGLPLVIVVSSSHAHWNLAVQLWNELMSGQVKRVYLPDAIGYAAHFIYEFDPGPPLKKVKLLPADIKLSASKKRLLRRAFHDCDQIYLLPLYGGRDSKGVFCVEAWLRRSEVGPRPLPFFVKISTVEKIKLERQNYQRYAEFFIPFYLRPNITPERCVSIGNIAAIVGNFVEESQPLRSALRSNPSPGVLFSLFENSLKGFRLQPRDSHMVHEGSLKDFIRGRTRARKVQKRIAQRARRLDSKLKSSAVELEKLLCNIVKNHKCALWPHHGDLHSGNVMVRGKDAIVIDFSAVKDAPISADVAALEVSLIFGTDASDQPKNFEIWKKVVDEIYERALCRQLPLEKVPGPYSWLRRAIRELYHISLGCDCKEEERKAVLAAYMIRFARLPIEDFADRKLEKMVFDRHAYALVVAGRIIQSLITPK